MRPLKELRLIEPEEERRQLCFHVMVAGAYSEWRLTKMVSEQQDLGATLREITTIGLPGLTAAP